MCVLMHLVDLTSVVCAIKKRLVKYKCKDGIDLLFMFYMLLNYVFGKCFFVVFYVYLFDYVDFSKVG